MVDDYDTNKQLIELLETSIERWEDGADEFADFNKALACVEPGIAVLKTLMNQHRLRMADLSELGSKSSVSKQSSLTKDKNCSGQLDPDTWLG